MMEISSLTETQLAYIAGIVDGEGSLVIHRSRPRNSKRYSHVAKLQIGMSDENTISFLASKFEIPYRKYTYGTITKGWKPRFQLVLAGHKKLEPLLLHMMPYLITKKMLSLFNGGTVILDLSVDYPNPIETCRPTLLDRPWYVVNGVKHVCIFGYPGLVPISSAKTYSKQIMPILSRIASTPVEKFPKYLKKALIIP